jgi:hypothetical protein
LTAGAFVWGVLVDIIGNASENGFLSLANDFKVANGHLMAQYSLLVPLDFASERQIRTTQF